MEDWSSYPPVEPGNFDLIIVGTGLPESLIAAAASAAGKTVLHVDPNPFYGCHFASLPLNDFIDFLKTHSESSPKPHIDDPNPPQDHNLFPLSARPVYSSLEINAYSPEIPESSRKFSLDLAGPKVLFCGDSMVDLILDTGINQYMDFRSVDSSFVCDCEGSECKLRSVPDSRSAIFKDKTLSFSEKNQLMRFFKLVEGHHRDGGVNSQISEEDLESPFAEFLSRKIGSSPKLKSAILYAISMADYDQDNEKFSEYALKTKEGIQRLILYHASVGRFPNAPGAMIYPIYGQGEFPQAFCRRAAVKGCTHVLRMPVAGVLGDKEAGHYKGVRLVTGQDLFSRHLILAPSFVVPSGLVFSPSHPQREAVQDFSLPDDRDKVARAVCITKSSLKLDVANCLIFLPPQSLGPEQETSVRAFQLSSNVAACPPDLFVVYLSTICDDAVQGKKLISAAIDALFTIPNSEDPKEISAECESEVVVNRVKPTLLWSILYAQELTGVALDSDHSTFMPDGNLLYSDLLDRTTKLFHKIYPNEEFFPKTISSDDPMEDVESDV